ncbi:MAG: hypothetical protein ACOYK6_06885 [Chthoniobacterales bacterium]
MNGISSSKTHYSDLSIEEPSSPAGPTDLSINHHEYSRRYSSASNTSTPRTDVETVSSDSPRSSYGKTTPLLEHLITSLNSSHDSDEEPIMAIKVPNMPESDDETTDSSASSEKKLAELYKKYSVTEKLLNDSLAHYPEVKKYLEKSEAFSIENIFNFLRSESSREKASERLEGRKELTKESLSFICGLQKKLNNLTVQIKRAELKEEYSKTKIVLDSLTTEDPEVQQHRIGLEQKLDALENEIEALEPEDEHGIWREVPDEKSDERVPDDNNSVKKLSSAKTGQTQDSKKSPLLDSHGLRRLPI